MWNTILIIVYLFVNVIAVVLLVREGSKPYRIWAWLMTIFAFPFVGALVFFFFGLNRRKRKLFDLKKIVDDEQTNVFLEKYQSDIEPRRTPDKDFYLQYGKLVELLTRTNNSPLTYNNKVAILNDGQETFEAIFKACESAKESIYIQYYIYENGELAARFAELFSRKIKQGVKILFSYDALGSWSLTDTYLANLKSMGVEVYPFMPVRFGALARTNYRNHRKILVVDGHIGFTGGINVDDKYIHGDPVLGHWADTHLRIEGMAVNFLKFLFFNDWYFVSGQNLFTPDVLQIMGPIGDTPVQLVASGPDSEHAGILYQYVHLINAAHDYVYIANPYLVPTESLLLALKSSALSGVDVRLVSPENSDSVIIKCTVLFSGLSFIPLNIIPK